MQRLRFIRLACLGVVLVLLSCELALSLGASVTSAFSEQTLQKTQKLEGPWTFYWQKLLEPSDPLPNEGLHVPTAIPWSQIKRADGTLLPSVGYGTYRMEIRGLSPRAEGYTIGLRNFKSSARILIFPNQRPERVSEAQIGKIGPSSSETIPSQNIAILNFFPQADEPTWTLLVQGANFYNSEGGFYLYSPILGTETAIRRVIATENSSSLFSLGILCVVSIYSFMMFLRHRKDLASLMLSLLCFLVAMRTIAMSDFLNYYLQIESVGLFRIQVLMEFLPIMLSPLVYLYFLHWTFPQHSSLKVVQTSAVYNLGVSCFMIATPPIVFQEYLPLYQMGFLPHIAWILLVMIRAIRHRSPGVYLILIGAVCCCGGSVWDILVAKQIVVGPFVMQYAVSVFMITQSEVVAQRAALAFYKSRKLAKDLKYEMQARVMMVSDLAHRTNNPLNYIATGINSLRDEIMQQNHDIRELFANADRTDPDVQAVIQHFEQRHRAMQEAIDSMANGVHRSASSVTEIRTMSGVDGYALVPVGWKAVLQAAKIRLKENIGFKADCLYIKTDGIDELFVRSNATALTLALEVIFRLWVGQGRHDVVVTFRHTNEDETQEMCRVHMECMWSDHEARDSDIEQVENLAYIIKPYGCTLDLSEDLKRISFNFEMKATTVVLADAASA